MITLHAHINRNAPNTLKLRVALAEAGAAYEYRAVNLDAGEQRRPEFQALNPHGKIPVLVDGDFVLAESDAILWYLGERFPDARLLPAADARDRAAAQGRARVLQWCAFSSTGLHQAFVDVYIHKVKAAPDQRVSWVGEAAMQKLDRLLGVMEVVLAQRAFLAGDFSLADLAAASVLHSVKARIPGDPTTGRAALGAWYQRVTDRQSWREAMASAEESK